MDKCAACKALLGEPTSKPAHMDLVLDTNGSGLTAASLQYGKSAEARVLRRWSVGWEGRTMQALPLANVIL